MEQENKNIEICSIAFENMSFQHEGGCTLFENISFSFPMDTMIQMRGPQGCGTSSLLKMLVGLCVPIKGKYLLNGIDISELSFSEFRQYQLSMGFGFDQGGLISNTTLLENLLLPLSYHKLLSREAAEARVYEYLQRFDILAYKALWPALASQGTRKACSLARAFVTHPQLLILDDPTEGLKHDGIRRLVETIKMHQRGYGLRHIIVATEDDFFLSFFKYQTIDIRERKLNRVQFHSRMDGKKHAG